MKGGAFRKLIACGLTIAMSASPCLSASWESRGSRPAARIPQFQSLLDGHIQALQRQAPLTEISNLRLAALPDTLSAGSPEAESARVALALLSNPDFAKLDSYSAPYLRIEEKLGRPNAAALQQVARHLHSLAASDAPLREALISAQKELSRLGGAWSDPTNIAAKLDEWFSGSRQSPTANAITEGVGDGALRGTAPAVEVPDFAAAQGGAKENSSLQPYQGNASASAGNSAPPSPSFKSKIRGKLKLWHKILISAVLTAVTLAVTWYFFLDSRMTAVKPPPSIVFVEKGPFKMQHEAASKLSRGPDPSNQALEMTLQSPGGSPVSAALADDLKTAVTVSADGSWRLWDLEQGAAFKPSRYPGKAIAATFAQQGRTLVLLDEDSTVRVIDLRADEVRTIAQNAGTVSLYSFSPDGGRLAIATKAGRVLILDILTAKVQAFKIDGEVLALGSTSKGTFVLAMLAGKVKLRFIPPGREPEVIDEWKMIGGRLASTGLNEDGTRAVVAGVFMGSQGAAYLTVGSSKFKIMSAGELELGPATIASVALDRPGTTAAILASDGRLWLWNPADEDLRLLGRSPSGGKVFFSLDGRRVYTTDLAGTVQVWSLQP